MFCIEGFLLGLGTGATCLISCGPILIPYLLGERRGLRSSFGYVGQFLLGRLAAYLLIGLLVGLIGESLVFNTHSWIFGVVFCVLALLMVAYGFHRFRQVCLGTVRNRVEGRLKHSFPALIPIVTGFLASLNLCPPLLLAISNASIAGGVSKSVVSFAAFFVGTAIYFLPLPFMALFRRNQTFQIIGKFAAIIAGVIFLYKGISIIINNL